MSKAVADSGENCSRAASTTDQRVFGNVRGASDDRGLVTLAIIFQRITGNEADVTEAEVAGFAWRRSACHGKGLRHGHDRPIQTHFRSEWRSTGRLCHDAMVRRAGGGAAHVPPAENKQSFFLQNAFNWHELLITITGNSTGIFESFLLLLFQPNVHVLCER